MADINAGQTRRLLVLDGNGVELTPAQFSAASDDEAIAIVSERGDQLEWDLLALSAGTATGTLTGVNDHAGQSGVFSFEVGEEPLTATLADQLPPTP